MKYVALLRGINVGGNSLIKMSELKEAFEEEGFENVRTYINSGNVLFETKQQDHLKIIEHLEKVLSKKFNLNLRLVVKTHEQMKHIANTLPKEWHKDDIRKYVAFIKEPAKAEEIAKEIKPREGVDFLTVGEGVLYMGTLLSGLTKSGFTKMAGTPIYKEMTIRNFNTVQKILNLMEENQ